MHFTEPEDRNLSNIPEGSKSTSTPYLYTTRNFCWHAEHALISVSVCAFAWFLLDFLLVWFGKDKFEGVIVIQTSMLWGKASNTSSFTQVLGLFSFPQGATREVREGAFMIAGWENGGLRFWVLRAGSLGKEELSCWTGRSKELRWFQHLKRQVGLGCQ